MLDKFGATVQKGDTVTITGVVDSIAPSDDHCMVRIETLHIKVQAAEKGMTADDITESRLVPCNVSMIQAGVVKKK